MCRAFAHFGSGTSQPQSSSAFDLAIISSPDSH
jgi:hypothetical protein